MAGENSDVRCATGKRPSRTRILRISITPAAAQTSAIGRSFATAPTSLSPQNSTAIAKFCQKSQRLSSCSMSRITAFGAACSILSAATCYKCSNTCQRESFFAVRRFEDDRRIFRELGAATSAVKIALVTYDQTIHFYDLGGTERPRVAIEADVSDVFVPFVDGFFVNYETAEKNLEM